MSTKNCTDASPTLGELGVEENVSEDATKCATKLSKEAQTTHTGTICDFVATVASLRPLEAAKNQFKTLKPLFPFEASKIIASILLCNIRTHVVLGT